MALTVFRRVIELGISDAHGLTLCGRPVSTEWRDLYLAHRPPLGSTSVPVPYARANVDTVMQSLFVTGPFRWTVKALEDFLRSGRNLNLRLVSAQPTAVPAGSSLATFSFIADHDSTGDDHAFVLQLGQCTEPSESIADRRWARVVYSSNPASQPSGEALDAPHSCTTDHICDYPPGSRDVGYSFNDTVGADWRRPVTLSFRPCPIEPTTLLVNMYMRPLEPVKRSFWVPRVSRHFITDLFCH